VTEPTINRLAESIADAKDLEGLTRPLLEVLEAITGMESTYLTTIDLDQGVQHILYSRNSRRMQIPEGLSVPWNDTLCKRALEEGRPYTDDVSACWGDSEAARALGIQTYLSQPVLNLDGSVYGTLCAASADRVRISDANIKVLNMVARLIAHQVERERQLASLRKSNEALSAQSLTDPLTGLPNRRALVLELARMLARAARTATRVQVAFVDLDGFKTINDEHGHDIGDRFLLHIAHRLRAGVRIGDYAGRFGGDEFVVIAPGDEADRLGERVARSTATTFRHGAVDIDYPGASVGVVVSGPGEADAEALLARADAAMYAVKKARRAAR
jgi:diguanylate cyclase